MISLIFWLASLTIAYASYCGQAAIPFTFQVLKSGQPVLGCARPRCFGWDQNGYRVADEARFYKIGNKEDGYLRRSDTTKKILVRHGFQSQIARCESLYRTTSCSTGEWVGGIAPLEDPLQNSFSIQCCSYGPLQNSQDRGVAPIKNGQIYIGGEVQEGPEKKTVAFDYISDVTKQILPNKTVLYDVYVRRMTCIPEETAPVEDKIIQNLDGDVNIRQNAINQQVPTAIQPTSPYGVQQNQIAQPVQQFPQQYQQIPQGFGQPMNLNGFPPQQFQWFPQVPFAPQPMSVPIQGSPQQQMTGFIAPQQPVGAVPQNPVSTMPQLNLPKLEELPQIQIPSVEQVEDVIPPMQKAILTNIAKFFGVL